MPVSDLQITTTSDAAQSALVAGIDGFNRWRVDAMGNLDAAIVAAEQNDESLTLAHAAKGIILYGGRHKKFRPMIEQCLADSKVNDRQSEHEQTYSRVLEYMVAGNLDRAVLELELHLTKNPTDVFGHRILQQELFWSGDAKTMKSVTERAFQSFSGDEPDYSTFLAVYAFSLEEAGHRTEAEKFGREAVSLDPSDPWAAHAVAHVLEMDGRDEEGIAWIEPLTPNWDGVNQMKHHLWWHLALFCLESGDHARILELVDTQIRNPESPLVQAMPDAYIDLQNVASILLRLQLRGVDVGDRWHTIADFCAERIDNHESPFTSAHAVMTLAACGRFEEAQTLVRSLDDFAQTNGGSLAPRVRYASLPAAKASLAWFKQDYQGVIDILMPARRELWRMGGSHAQRDVFVQILFQACRKLDRADFTAMILDDLTTTGFTQPNNRSLYAAA